MDLAKQILFYLEEDIIFIALHPCVSTWISRIDQRKSEYLKNLKENLISIFLGLVLRTVITNVIRNTFSTIASAIVRFLVHGLTE